MKFGIGVIGFNQKP